MNIGIDYDDTITADPVLFSIFIQAARSLGHDIRIVTCRSEAFGLGEVFEFAAGFSPELLVINTSGMEKDGYCKKYHDFHVDVWLDDNPHWIGTKDKDEWKVRPVE